LEYFNIKSIDILVNNAGFSQRTYFIDFNENDNLKMLNVNLTTPLILSKLVLNDIINDDNISGHIVNISSVAGRLNPSCRTTYSAVKSGLIGFGTSIQSELNPYPNVSVSTILPGPVKTNVDVEAAGKNGAKYDKRDAVIQTGMTPLRCSQLICIAISNNINEAWISTRPVLDLMYIVYYLPGIFGYIRPSLNKRMKQVCGY